MRACVYVCACMCVCVCVHVCACRGICMDTDWKSKFQDTELILSVS